MKNPIKLINCGSTEQKIKFSIKDFFSKCDQIRWFLRIWSHFLKKSVMENFIFYALQTSHVWLTAGKFALWKNSKWLTVNFNIANYYLKLPFQYKDLTYLISESVFL